MKCKAIRRRQNFVEKTYEEEEDFTLAFLFQCHFAIALSAAAPLQQLFQIVSDQPVELSDSQRISMDDLKVKEGEDGAAANVFSGQEDVFAFKRTLSRLQEMQTDALEVVLETDAKKTISRHIRSVKMLFPIKKLSQKETKDVARPRRSQQVEATRQARIVTIP
uniref:FH2 domain-containing protein n=1 Tax=Bursaphelenchus xylophilus TaxID=6326 RepID=A0A1I7RVG2_BURXY